MKKSIRIFTTVLFTIIAINTSALAIDLEPSEKKLKSVKAIIEEAKQGVTYIGIDLLKEKISNEAKFVLLDVRTSREYNAGYIKGAAWVQSGIADFVLARTLPDPDADIVVYCKKGNRTGNVVKKLIGIGYKNVVGLDGGFDSWVQSGNSFYNFLGEATMLNLAPINASDFSVDYYQSKK